jgi:hypothetical protein
MAETRRQRVDALLAALKLERSPWEADWRDLGDYFLPSRVQWNPTDRNRGDRRNQKIIDPTGSLAARTFGSGMHTHITSSARLWFGMTPERAELAELPTVKAYCADVVTIMSGVLQGSNYYQLKPGVYEDLGVFGTAAYALLEDDEDVVRCYDFPLGSYYLATDEKRRVRVFVHEYSLTVRQIVARFARRNEHGAVADWSNISLYVRNLYERGQLDIWVDCLWVIEPNETYDPTKLESGASMPYRACHYETSRTGAGAENMGDKVLEEKGFQEFPIIALRWKVRGNDVYGNDCPGKMAIGDVKQLQLMEKRGAQGLDKMVSPPLLADPNLMSTPVNTLPGGITYSKELPGSAKESIRPTYQVNIPLDKLEVKEEQIRARIEHAFYVDLFLMLTQLERAEITAAEIYERKDEKLLAMAPVVERVNYEDLGPGLERVYAICARRGLLPEPPPELDGQALKLEYESVMHQAQRAVALGTIDRLTTYVSNLAVAKQDPTVFDKLDLDAAIAEYATGAGAPPKLVLSDAQVQQIRDGRAQAQQLQTQTALLKDASAGAKQLSETNTRGPNALTDLLGQGDQVA